MALRVRSTSNGSPANIVSARHASATGGEKRLIRLRQPANDNRPERNRWTRWIALAALVSVVAFWLA